MSTKVLSSRIYPESTLKLFNTISVKEGSTWSYRKTSLYADIFWGDGVSYRVDFFGEFIRVPTAHCFDWLPPGIIKYILSSDDGIKIFKNNVRVYPQSRNELNNCQIQSS
jgi:hypothetical protein